MHEEVDAAGGAFNIPGLSTEFASSVTETYTETWTGTLVPLTTLLGVADTGSSGSSSSPNGANGRRVGMVALSVVAGGFVFGWWMVL